MTIRKNTVIDLFMRQDNSQQNLKYVLLALFFRSMILVDCLGIHLQGSIIRRLEMKRSLVGLALPLLLVAGFLSFMQTSCSHEIVMHEISFNSQGGSAVVAVEAIEGQRLNEPIAPTKEGYSFDGWYEESECLYRWNFEKDVVVSDMTLYAKWTAYTYMVTYHANEATGGLPPADQEKIHDVDQVLWGNTGILVREGYAFSGWNTLANGSGTDYAAGSSYAADASVMLYAKWTPNSDTEYTVEHYRQDVSGNEYTKYETENKTGTTGSIAVATAKSYSGFTVNTSHGSIVTNGTIAADGTLVLKLYYDRETFTVIFAENEGSTVSDLAGIRYGATIDEPTPPTRIGYSFDGWYKESELTHAWSFTEDVISNTTTLHAKWTPVIYTITYVLNNGTNDAGNPVTYTIESSVITLLSPVRTGYPFEGWFASSDFSGSPIVLLDTGSSGDKTLYAKWKVYRIGDIGPAGGYIFHDKGTYSGGWQYLEAAPYGWYNGTTDSDGPYSGNDDPFFQWGVQGFAIDPAATATAVGSGASNTEKIVSFHDALGTLYPAKGNFYTNPTNYHAENDGTVAAKVCAEYSLDQGSVTFDDWFLPSKDELNWIYNNFMKLGVGGFHEYGYWSSTESMDINNAYSQNFYGGFQGNSSRYYDLAVRPVRAF